MSEKVKPLGRKAYGSIGHLPESRMGPGDHKVSDGQARIATERARDKHDVITVTEKLDGSCTAVANVDGVIVPLGRAGWTADSSPYEQHRMFSDWVYAHQSRFDFLEPGERLVGEWLAQAHGTRYTIKPPDEPWLVFDLFTNKTDRATYKELTTRANMFRFPALLAAFPQTVPTVMLLLGTEGFHHAIDPVEGAVWRVERREKFDFLCKYVRPEKVDGLYLESQTGKAAVWNWKPSIGDER